MTKHVKLGWKAMPRATQYELQYREVGSNTWSSIVSSNANYIEVDLEVGKSYQYRVRTICGTEVTDWAYLGVNVFSNDGACITPAGILVEQLADSYDFRVSWINTGVTGWNFRYRKQGDLTWSSTVLSEPEVILTSLVIGATYEYQVQSICTGSVVSDWGNLGSFDVRNTTGTQSCPIEYEDEFSGTLMARKDTSNVVNISGDIEYISADPLPAAGDFIIVGDIGLCCAPVADITIPVSSSGFTGELTITAAGQLNLYIASFTGSPALDFNLSAISYQGYAATCPPPTGGGANEITGTLTYACSSGGAQGQAIISMTFPEPTPAPIALLIGVVEQWSASVVYRGSDIFTPPPGSTPESPSADAHAPYLINIPAGVTTFVTSGNIIQKGFGNDGVHMWSCHYTRPISDLYIKVDSPATYVANLNITNSGITLHNV